MKNNTVLICTAMIVLSLFSCTETPKTVQQPFPDRDRLEAIARSVIMTSYYADNDGGRGHGCLYANKHDKSFIILPTHCFPHDPKKKYHLEVTDFKGRVTKVIVEKSFQSPNWDAELLITTQVNGVPSLCNRSMVSTQRVLNDSVTLLCPFDVRGIYQKFGTLIDTTQVEMSILFGEPGDSGGLVISRDGVIGLNVSGSENGKKTNFVPIAVFEQLYGEATDWQRTH